ncbi:MAG: helix-turn-helix transcriptional regulator [Lentisphaeria bacterium]|nr:helix-turn-helix transcriptional regulator [Lentisphaeria bacterium]
MNINSIEPELLAFERVLGCRICLHPFTDIFFRGTTRLFSSIRQSHRRTYPDRCGKEQRSYCIRHCMDELNRRIAASPSRDLFAVHCRNGCFELASPVYRGGRCVLVMFAGLLDVHDREKIRTIGRMLPVFAAGIEARVYGMAVADECVRDTLPERAREYIEQHYAESISTSRAARALCVSVSHLCHALRSAGEGSFSQMLTAERMLRAKQLLTFADPDIRLTDIARLCGFARYEHFCRSFSGAVGMSPSAWRKRNA